jgi:hypothetical protein
VASNLSKTHRSDRCPNVAPWAVQRHRANLRISVQFAVPDAQDCIQSHRGRLRTATTTSSHASFRDSWHQPSTPDADPCCRYRLARNPEGRLGRTLIIRYPVHSCVLTADGLPRAAGQRSSEPRSALAAVAVTPPHRPHSAAYQCALLHRCLSVCSACDLSGWHPGRQYSPARPRAWLAMIVARDTTTTNRKTPSETEDIVVARPVTSRRTKLPLNESEGTAAAQMRRDGRLNWISRI